MNPIKGVNRPHCATLRTGRGGGEESSYPLMTLCDMWLTPGKKSSMIGVEPIVSYIIFQCVDTRFPPCARMEVEPIFR